MTQQEPAGQPAADIVAQAMADFRRSMDWARTTFAIGNSFARYRLKDMTGAEELIRNLPFEQRDMVLRWAAWLVGLGEDNR